jgi:hypothetical protein
MSRSVAIGLGVFVLAFCRSMADGIGLVDESWFLQVVARIRSGDVLYRDVFLGTTPLSAYATAALTWLTGVEVVAVKIVTNACFAVTTVMAGRFARLAGLSDKAALVVMAAMFVWARPYNNPPYTPMAVMFFVAAIVTTFATFGRQSGSAARSWVWAGVMAGLAFASKQNVGLLALGAAGIGCVMSAGVERQPFVRPVMWMSAGFAAAALVALAPVIASGGMPGLWDYGFVGKGAYLDIGSVSDVGSLGQTFGPLASGMSMAAMSTAFHGLVLLAPVAMLLVTMTAASRLDRRDWVLVAFALAAAAIAFPRWDRFHMAYAVPVHLVTIGRILRHLPMGSAGVMARRLGGWGLAALAVVVAGQPVATLARGGRESLAIEHFQGPVVPADTARRLREEAASLRAAAGARPIFITRRDAGFWYLSAGIRNPTPFDMPARTATGATGIERLIAGLETGAIDQVCLGPGESRPQSLTEVEAFVRERFQQVGNTGPCTIFRMPERHNAEQRPS